MQDQEVKKDSPRVVVIGAGPAGLTAALELQKRSPRHVPVVVESGDLVGGIARTESYKGFRFDIGGHRFFTKVGEVEQMWHEIMGDDFIVVPRKSRIYYRSKFYDYPLKIFNTLQNIGVYESGRIILSYAKWRMKPSRIEESFEQWVINRFGRRLYMHFFRSYTEKVWGISPREIRADWAAQRIKNLSLWKVVINAITGANSTTSLIEKFHYPRLGPGMMWEKVRDRIKAQGGEVRMRSRATRLLWEGRRVQGVEVTERSADGADHRYIEAADHVLNTMALTDLIAAFDPPPPEPVRAAAARLRYRDFLIVTLILDHPDPFPDNWVYIHSSEVKVGRIQNFRAWSAEMMPNSRQASIGMEYFCHEGDGLWAMSDADLIELGAAELEQLGLAPKASVVDGSVIRQVKAYPVYDGEYGEALDVIAGWLGQFENFQTIGRNGLHRYNNQDHSMLTGMLAARNILGERHDVWTVNVERSYHEEFELKRKEQRAK